MILHSKTCISPPSSGSSSFVSVQSAILLSLQVTISDSKSGIQLATLLIAGRTIARLISLRRGWANDINNSQLYTLLLDGAFVLIACIILTVMPAGGAFGSSWRLTSPSFGKDRDGSLSLRQRFGRRNGYRRPANISLPVRAPPQHAYSPGSPPYHPPGAPSPPFPTPPLYSYSPASPPYRPGGPSSGLPQPSGPPSKGGPANARLQFPPGQAPIMSPGFSPRTQGFIPSHRRQQTSRGLVNSDVLW